MVGFGASGAVLDDSGGSGLAPDDPGNSSGSGENVFRISIVILQVSLAKDEDGELRLAKDYRESRETEMSLQDSGGKPATGPHHLPIDPGV